MAEFKKPQYSLFIDRDSRKIELRHSGISTFFPLNNIPLPLYEAIANLADTGTVSSLEAYRTYAHSSVHKAFIATNNPSSIFEQNASMKLIRLSLRDEVIEDTIEDLEGELLALQGQDFESLVDIGFSIYRNIYADESRIDPLNLGAIEMYGTTTYHNILSDPRVSLLVTWYDQDIQKYTAYQLNCIAEVIAPGTPYYRYMRFMRALLRRKYLDLGEGEYTCAYRFWISEVKEKSLKDKEGFGL